MNIYWELFGYVGTALVILSMTMTSVVKLRLINIAGSIISAIYSVIGGAWPIVVMNVCLIVINAVHLIRERRHKPHFGHITVSIEDKYLQHFLSYYREDIQRYFPHFTDDPSLLSEIHMVCIGSEAVGVTAGVRHHDTLHISLDYATPKYRDLSVGKFLYPLLKSKGITTLTAHADTPTHEKYLSKMGFIPSKDIMQKKL